MKKAFSITIALLLLVSAGVGAVAAANTSNYQTGTGGTFHVLKGTNGQKSTYKINVSTGTSGNPIILESPINVSAVPNESVTTTGQTGTAVNTHWKYNKTHNVYYQKYAGTTTSGYANFTFTNGTAWSTTGSSTAINTSRVTPVKTLIGVNVSSTTTVTPGKLGNMATNDTYKIVASPVTTNEAFSGPVKGTVNTSGNTVNVTAGSPATDTVSITNTGKYNTGNETFTVHVSNSLASPSNVGFQNITNAKLSTSSTSGATSTYTFDVQNTSKNASAQVVLGTSGLSSGTSVAGAVSVTTAYTAHVVGHTAMTSGPYDFNIVTSSAPAPSPGPTGTILPLPSFLANLGTLGQLIGFGILVFNILGTILALYLLSQINSISSGTRKAGTVGLPLLAIVSFLTQWALIGYMIVILVVDIYLYYQYSQEQSRSSQSSYNMMG